MLIYREITGESDLRRLAEFTIEAADALGDVLDNAYVEKTLREFRRSHCIGIYDGKNLIGSIIIVMTPPYYLLDMIPQEEAKAFYAKENITQNDCVQVLYIVFPGRSVWERLEFYRILLKEMIKAGKEHILIYYKDNKYNRHQLYRRVKPEIIAEKGYPEFTKRLTFARRSFLMKELENVEKQMASRQKDRAF